MTPAALQRYLHEHIPLTRAMDVQVISIADANVVLGAPLAPNVNHHGTAFGGSGATLATLAAWSLLHLRLIAMGLPSDEVIQSSTMDYLTPIDSDFTAVARLEDGADWDGFVATLRRRGRARIGLQADLVADERVAARFKGRFVAVLSDRA